MKKDPGVFQDHILECIDLIEDYSKGVTESEFMGSLSLQDMIIRSYQSPSKKSIQRSPGEILLD